MNAAFMVLALTAAQWGSGGCASGRCAPMPGPMFAQPQMAFPAFQAPVAATQAPSCPNGCQCGSGGECKCGENCPCCKFEYKPAAAGDDVWLYRNGVHVGGWNGEAYHPWDGSKWLSAGKPPVKPPTKAVSRKEAIDAVKQFTFAELNGVDRSRIAEAPSYSISGTAVSEATAKDRMAVGAPGLVDDTSKPWLVVRTNDDNLRRTIYDGLAPVRDNFRLISYPPGHWALQTVNADRGLVMVLAPDGKELHRQDDLDGGVPALIGAVRKADPKYDPSLTPDLRKPQLPSLPDLSGVKKFLTTPDPWLGIPYGVYIAGLVVFLFLRSRSR
jgi:hypothetical protein